MAASESEATLPAATTKRWVPYYGWMIVVMSALAMLATLPGRTHGLGMITERLLKDPALSLDRVRFGDMNFWATILGAIFCLPCGKLIDRYGSRLALTVVSAGLGLVVLGMTHVTSFWMFFIAITLTRGLGQSALSVVSLSMTGKWFSRRLGLAMGIYSVVVALLYGSAFGILKDYKDYTWQAVWGGMGWILLLGMAPLGWLLVRNTPEEYGLLVDGGAQPVNEPMAPAMGHTLRQALVEPSFWAFAIATSMYGLITSGTSLFNQDILRELGFGEDTFYLLGKVAPMIGLFGNFFAGVLVQWTSLRFVMALSMASLAGALFWMPHVTSINGLWGYTVGFGMGGGMMTVVFFTAFGKVFGRLHLGQIQAVAQMLTVFASAAGPMLAAQTQKQLDSYMPYFTASACVVAALAIWAVVLKMPAQSVATNSDIEPVKAEA